MKIDFSKNSKARKIMIIATCCLSIILSAFSSFDAYAEELSLIDLLNIQDVFITRSDLGDGNYVSFFEDNTYEETYHNLYNNGFEYTPNEAVLGQLNSGDYVNYLGCFNGNFTQFTLFYLPEDCFAVQNNSTVTLYTSYQYSDLGGGYRAGFPIFRTSDFEQFSVEWNEGMPTKTIDNENYYIVAQYLTNIASLSIPVYYYNASDFNFTSMDDLIELDNPIVDSGVSDEDILNNDYLGENNCILMDASSLENGKWSVYLDWNENQLENLDDYQVNATFELTGNVTFDGNANDYTDICVSYYGLTPNESGTYILDKTFSSTSSLSGTDNISSITFNFSQINDSLKSGSKNVIAFAQMVDKMRGTNSVKSGTSNFVNRLFSGTYFGFKVPLYSNTEDKISYNTLNYTCTVDVLNKETGKSILSNPLVQPYNMLTGQAGTFVNGGVSQDKVNQVVTDNLGNTSGYQGSIEVSNGGDGGNATGGSSNNTNSGNNNNSSIESGAIVINNNPTFNNDVASNSESSAGLGSNLLTTILKYIVGSKGSSVDLIDDLADSTGWFNIVNQTYTFVPTAFWNLIITCFTVCLGIVIVSFIISMVIKIIT